jgi:hypothetical protein
MKKLDEGEILVCYTCHKKGHKSYESKVKGGEKKKEKKQKAKLSHAYTNWVDKKKATPFLLKLKNRKVRSNYGTNPMPITSATCLRLVVVDCWGPLLRCTTRGFGRPSKPSAKTLGPLKNFGALKPSTKLSPNYWPGA